jgi:4-amino-4-deoxy-L-arabinose transferase-like glycosyltransferase
MAEARSRVAGPGDGARRWLVENRWPWVIGTSALAVRLLYLLQSSASPLYSHPVVDAQTYSEQAAWLAAGHWLGVGEGPFWQPPLYPCFLGVVRALFPESFFSAARLIQAGLGAGACVLVYWLGRRWFAPPVGLLAGGAAALYGPLIYFDGELLPASLATLLNLAGLALLVRAGQRPSLPRYALAGLVFGLAAVTVSTVLVFVAAAAAWVWWRRAA